ncbi:hypothetical protein AAVH_35305, partial [Aphelenchoides avenae]
STWPAPSSWLSPGSCLRSHRPSRRHTFSPYRLSNAITDPFVTQLNDFVFPLVNHTNTKRKMIKRRGAPLIHTDQEGFRTTVLSAKLLVAVLEGLGTDMHTVLLDHINSFGYNNAGAKLLLRDITKYSDLRLHPHAVCRRRRLANGRREFVPMEWVQVLLSPGFKKLVFVSILAARQGNATTIRYGRS